MSNRFNMMNLTSARQELLVRMLGGNTLEFRDGAFGPDSRRSLEAIGLTPIEVNGLESANRDRPTAVIPTSIPSEDKSNPWTRAGFSLTRQGEIARDNPVLAERMKAEAGIK